MAPRLQTGRDAVYSPPHRRVRQPAPDPGTEAIAWGKGILSEQQLYLRHRLAGEMMAENRRHYWTAQEFLAFEAESEFKHELIDGEVYDMSGGTGEHARSR